jgi:putative ABC transport system permease protein
VAHLIATAPWRRAPLRLLHQPRLLGAALLVAVVVGVVAATPLLFLSSAASGAVTHQLAPLCRGTSIDPNVRSVNDTTPIELAADHVPGFEPVVHTLLLAGSFGRPLEVRTANGSKPVIIGTRTGYAEHLRPIGPTVAGDGIWLPDDVATALGVHAGDEVSLGAQDQSTPSLVVGVYPSLVQHGFDGYWCSLRPYLGTSTTFVDNSPPPLVLTDARTLAGIRARFPLNQRANTLEVPLASIPTTLTAARHVVERLDELQAAVPEYVSSSGPVNPTANTRLRYATARAGAIRTSVSGAVAPMAVVSALVALGLVCGVTGSWLDRRRTEVRLLWVRGVPAGLIGLKAVLELLVPMVVGTAVGFGLAAVLIPWIGPSAHLDPGVIGRAAGWAVAAFAVALVAVGLTVVVRLRRGLERAGARRRRVPILWEVPVLLLAAWSLHRFNEQGLPTVEGDALPPIDVLSLLFPLLFLAGCLGLAARLLRLLLAVTRRIGRRWPMAWYLALRRLAAERDAVLLLAGLAAMAVGVVVYGSGLVRSTNATVRAKAGVDLGANVVVRFAAANGVPPPLAGRATVARTNREADYGGAHVDLLMVDPATFADGAFWDSTFADRPVTRLMQELAGPALDGAVPAIAVAGDLAPQGTAVATDVGAPSGQVRIVDRVAAFPGMTSARPMLVTAEGRLPALEDGMDLQVWTTASADEVRRVADGLGWPIVYLVDAAQITDTSPALPVVWTFSFVQALGVMVGLLAIVGLVAYVDARQRQRSVATALLARMGLSARRHWRSLATELALLAGIAVVLGAALGWVAVDAVHHHLDPIPGQLPAPLLRFPFPAVAGVVAVAVATVLVGSWLAQRAARRVDLGEALREDI